MVIVTSLTLGNKMPYLAVLKQIYITKKCILFNILLMMVIFFNSFPKNHYKLKFFFKISLKNKFLRRKLFPVSGRGKESQKLRFIR